MRRCIQLAQNGLGTTYPNPLVGCVLVVDSRIVGEGWHYRAGQAHAEVLAIQQLSDPSLLKKATLYVSLEPCSHHGRTPPCSQLIIEKGIKNIVIGSTDPNPKVAGSGIRLLEAAGCSVITGVLEDECNALNKRFFTYHLQKRPYIFLKWAETTDRFLAPEIRDMSVKAPVWITSENTRQLVHKMRSREMAILTGTRTVLDDDPELTTRQWFGASPIRIVLDRNNKIPSTAKVFNDAAPTMVISEEIKEMDKNIRRIPIDFSNHVPQQICKLLYQEQVQSLIVEGGRKTLMSFIEVGLWDEAFIFKGPGKFKRGLPAPEISGTLIQEFAIGEDYLQIIKHLAE